MNKHFFLFLLSTMVVQYAVSQQLVSMVTNKGEIIVKLYDATPKHKSNFIRLVQEGYYDSTLFHRVIKDFMIQGGDPQSRSSSRSTRLGNGGPGYTIESEIKSQFIHKKGALAAARLADDENPKRRSSGSQFYIVEGSRYPRKYMPRFEEKNGVKYTEADLITYESLGGTPHLDGQYTVFGEVVKGLDIVEAISVMKTSRNDRPLENVYILKTKLIKP